MEARVLDGAGEFRRHGREVLHSDHGGPAGLVRAAAPTACSVELWGPVQRKLHGPDMLTDCGEVMAAQKTDSREVMVAGKKGHSRETMEACAYRCGRKESLDGISSGQP